MDRVVILKSYGIGNGIMVTPLIQALTDADFEVSIVTDLSLMGGPVDELLKGWDKLKHIWPSKQDGFSIDELNIKIVNYKPKYVIESIPGNRAWDGLMDRLDRALNGAITVIRTSSIQDPTKHIEWSKHEVEYNYDLVLDILKERGVDPYKKFYPLYVSVFSFEYLQFVADRGINIGISPSYKHEGKWHRKHWGDNNYADLCKLFIERIKDLNAIYILDGEQGKQHGANIKDLVGDDRVVDLTGRYSVGGTVYIMSKLDAVISNDSGPMHMAVAAGTKHVLGIFTMVPPVKTRPWVEKTWQGDYIRTRKEDCPCHIGTSMCVYPECVNKLDAYTVMGAFMQMISRGSRYEQDLLTSFRFQHRVMGDICE